MDFEQRLGQLDISALKTCLAQLKSPCYESDLMKAAFTIDSIPFAALELYQLHFILFHTLYNLQNEYAEQGLYLHIHFMRTLLLPYPAKGFCRHYNPEGFFCGTETEGNYCDFHKAPEEEQALDNLSARYFYLDKSNYDSLSGEDAEAFIRGTWELMTNWDKVEEARNILGLPLGFDEKMLRNKFKKLAKTHHPDISDSSEFIRINNAYCLLKNLKSVSL